MANNVSLIGEFCVQSSPKENGTIAEQYNSELIRSVHF